MKKFLLKLLQNVIIKNLPRLLDILSKREDKYGIAVKKSMNVYKEFYKSIKDGIIDEKEIQKLTPKITESIAAWIKIFNKKGLHIRVKKLK